MFRRYSFVRQNDGSDCGAAALATVALCHRMPERYETVVGGGGAIGEVDGRHRITQSDRRHRSTGVLPAPVWVGTYFVGASVAPVAPTPRRSASRHPASVFTTDAVCAADRQAYRKPVGPGFDCCQSPFNDRVFDTDFAPHRPRPGGQRRVGGSGRSSWSEMK